MGNDFLSLQDAVITSMTLLAAARDNETGNHIQRTQSYVRALAAKAASRPRYGRFLQQQRIDTICKAAPLHDIGKVCIPDTILYKNGPLDPQEFDVIKQHTVFGKDILLAAKERLGGPPVFLETALEIVFHHHEKWDGSGYPSGLKGESIPLAARLMAIADVFDALITSRPYKDAYSCQEAFARIVKAKGSHFDPELIEALEETKEQFIAIAEQYRDTAGEAEEGV